VAVTVADRIRTDGFRPVPTHVLDAALTKAWFTRETRLWDATEAPTRFQARC
jgi:hypothetical protein